MTRKSDWPPRGMSREEAADYVGVSPNTFDKMVADGRMPEPIPVNARRLFDRLAIDRAFAALGDQSNLNQFD